MTQSATPQRRRAITTATCLAFVAACVAMWSPSSIRAADAAPAADDLAAKSDEFDKGAASLRKWSRIFRVERSGADQLARLNVDAKTGKLVLIPHTSVWYQDFRGVLVFQNIEGDFVASTQLAVHRRQGEGAPRSQFSLAGLMLRTPRDVTPQTWAPGGENYVFLSMGAASQPGQYQLEVKTTVNSNSQLEITEGAPEGQLRAARIGSAIILLKRLPDQPWQVHRRYNRTDMPATLQVGLTCYTDWQTCQRMDPATHNRTVIRGGNPDLVAEVDYVRFARPAMPAGLAGRNLADSNVVSDAELLAFLGDAMD